MNDHVMTLEHARDKLINRKLNELSAGELAEFEKRLANAEPQQQISEQGCAEG